MSPQQILVLPKPDRRYRVGNISKDRNGKYRGHPDTVTPRPLPMPHNTLGLPFDLNPPLLVSNELADYLTENT